MKRHKTFAQIVIGSQEEYLDYDFEKRKKLRQISKKFFINADISKKNLLDLKKILDIYKINFILMFGTLLGAVRDNNFIEYDSDTDIAIHIDDFNKLINASHDLIKIGFKLIRTKEPDDLVTFMRDDEYIDIGIFRREEINNKSYFVYQNHYEYDDNFFQTIDLIFLDHSFKIPRSYKSLLTNWYGSNWKKRIKNRPAWPTKISNFRKILFITKTRIPFLQSVINKTKIIINKLLNVINNK